MAAKKKDTITLPRGIRPHRSGYIVDVTVGGKRRTKTAATLEAALLAREALRNAASAASNSAGAGDDTSRDDWTLEQATERTMQVVWAGKSAYKTMLINSKAVLGFFGADTPVQDITLDDIDRFVAHLLNERGNSGGTVNRKLSCLSRILRTAFERGKLEKMPKMPKRRRQSIASASSPRRKRPGCSPSSKPRPRRTCGMPSFACSIRASAAGNCGVSNAGTSTSNGGP